jgi:hypothetical protein
MFARFFSSGCNESEQLKPSSPRSNFYPSYPWDFNVSVLPIRLASHYDDGNSSVSAARFRDGHWRNVLDLDAAMISLRA